MIRESLILLLVLIVFEVDGLAQQTSAEYPDSKSSVQRYAGVLSGGFSLSKVQIDLTANPVEISTRYLFRLRNDENRHPFWFDAYDVKSVTDRKQLDALYDSLGKTPPQTIKRAYATAKGAYSFRTNTGVPGKMLTLSWLLLVCTVDGERAEIVLDCLNVDKSPETQALLQIDKLEPALPSE